MLRDSAVSLIATRLGNRTDLDSRIVAEMQYVQEMLENREYLPVFLLSDITSLATVADQDYVSLPSDFLREYEEGNLWYYDSTVSAGVSPWKEMSKRPVQDVKEGYSLTTDSPEVYALLSDKIIVGPVPNAAYTLKFYYYARDAVLSSNIENQWLKYAPDLMIALTGLQVATFIQDATMINTFGAMATDADTRFMNADQARRHANQDYRMEYK
jgi:hypothetical protein